MMTIKRRTAPPIPAKADPMPVFPFFCAFLSFPLYDVDCWYPVAVAAAFMEFPMVHVPCVLPSCPSWMLPPMLLLAAKTVTSSISLTEDIPQCCCRPVEMFSLISNRLLMPELSKFRGDRRLPAFDACELFFCENSTLVMALIADCSVQLAFTEHAWDRVMFPPTLLLMMSTLTFVMVLSQLKSHDSDTCSDNVAVACSVSVT